MSETVYRIQDQDGRGPYKPGFSECWSDEEGPELPLPGHIVWGMSWLNEILSGQHAGFGFRSLEQLQRWFSPTELDRLAAYGYQVVKIEVSRILRENADQLLFVRNTPLREDVEVLLLTAGGADDVKVVPPKTGIAR